VIDSIHDFRHTVAFGLWSERFYQERYAERSDDWHKNDKRPPRARRRMSVGIVGYGHSAEKKEVVEEGNQNSEDDSSQTGDNSD
jgi:hypothetical protein